MNEYYLAIDIGASGGRHIVGAIESGKLVLREVYRFENSMAKRGGRLVWDTDYILAEILAGMKKCKEAGLVPKSVGLDTWGVDYVLLDAGMERVGPAYAYRNLWTEGMDTRLDAAVPPEELYRRTGLQRLTINTIYQLMAQSEFVPEETEKAGRLLMLPDYFHFLLCGEPLNEYTIASTSGLLDVRAKNWDYELIAKIGFDASVFGPLSMPGTRAGALKKAVAEEVGFSADVVLPGSHDTASAAVATPSLSGDPIFLSSGTWSLLGCESSAPYTSESSMRCDFSNEGGYDGRILFLKNIRGLWMIQSVRKELANGTSYGEICGMAEASDIQTRVDPDDERFLSPESMTEAIRAYVRERGGRVPEGIGETAAVIYRSLADHYGKTARDLAEVTGRSFTSIHVMGGGSNAGFLNMLTAEATGLPVHAGPAEATAAGNILCQMISDGVFRDLSEARKCIVDSFAIQSYEAVCSTAGSVNHSVDRFYRSFKGKEALY